MTIIVDSDGLIGLLDEKDAHYKTSQLILEKLTEHKARLIYPATVITESVTILRIRLKKPELGDQIAALLLNDKLTIEPIGENLLKQAAILLSKGKENRHNTLFDGVVAAVADKYKADAIFSFDKFYKSKGFKLASEL